MNQIVQYSDSSEDESSSDDEGKNANKQQTKSKIALLPAVTEDVLKQPESKKMRLELPSAVLSMFKDSEIEEVADEPGKHKGRIRSFAHVPGNWATHVYLPIVWEHSMEQMIDELIALLPRSSEWHKMESLHVSVSKTVVVRHHWIESLRESLSETLQHLKPFQFELNSVELYANEEETRTFLGLRLGTGVEDIKQIVRCVDGVFDEFQLDTYYKDPSFHASVAWALGDMRPEITDTLQNELKNVLQSYLNYDRGMCVIPTNRVEAKCGNKIFSFSMKPQR